VKCKCSMEATAGSVFFGPTSALLRLPSETTCKKSICALNSNLAAVQLFMARVFKGKDSRVLEQN